MCVPLCTVALTDIYKLPSDGGSGSSHINHCEHQVPHFSQAPRLLLLIFFHHLLKSKDIFPFLKRNVFANNSKSILCMFFSSAHSVTFAGFTLVTQAVRFSAHIPSCALHQGTHRQIILGCLCDFVALPHIAVCARKDFFPFVSSTITSKNGPVCRTPGCMSLQVNVYAAGAPATGNGNG